MYTCQCKGWQEGQSSGVLLKEVALFLRCPLIEVSLYNMNIHKQVYMYMAIMEYSSTPYVGLTQKNMPAIH